MRPREEQETVVHFTREEDFMIIDTTDATMMTKLDKKVANNPREYKIIDIGKIGKDIVSKTYQCPKKFLHLSNKTRIYTEEEKKELKERAKKNFHCNKKE